MEGAVGAYSHLVCNRYGERMLKELTAEGYSFERSREETTWRIGVGPNRERRDSILFKNISLVPGRDVGFEIVQGSDAESER